MRRALVLVIAMVGCLREPRNPLGRCEQETDAEHAAWVDQHAREANFSAVDSFLGGTMRGMTGGLSDEIKAVTDGTYGRESVVDAALAHPDAHFAGTWLGAVALGVFLMRTLDRIRRRQRP